MKIVMSYINRINKKLNKEFGSSVHALEADGCLVLEGSLGNWSDVVRAGLLAVNKKRYRGLVNNIKYTGDDIPPMRVPAVKDTSLGGLCPDVLVVGGGVTGSAIARELARYKLDILLVEKEHDLAMHASSRNDGMVHPGLDLHKGTLKHKYNLAGNRMYDRVTRELGVPFERMGQYLCFGSPLLIPFLYLTLPYWKWLGIPGARVLGKKELRRREPGLNDDLRAALWFPSAGSVCPYNLAIAYGENAVQNGVRLSLDTAVLGMDVENGRIKAVKTNRGTVHPKVVVNAAGVFAEDIAKMAGDRFYSIHPRKGTNSILDNKFTGIVSETTASKMGESTSKKHSKGGGIVRTVHGNLLIGPDAVETYERENFATEASSVAATFVKFKATSEHLNQGQIITYFSGIRAPTYEEDFMVCKGQKTANFVHAAGIQSPGLTAAPAIAVDAARFAAELLETDGLSVKPNADFNPLRPKIPHTAAMSDRMRQLLIKENPDYGVILCRCEEVSKGEILDALRRPIPCDTVDGVKRRVRPGMGRCQGGFCGPLVLRLIAEEKGIPLEQVTKNGPGGEVLCGESKVG